MVQAVSLTIASPALQTNAWAKASTLDRGPRTPGLEGAALCHSHPRLSDAQGWCRLPPMSDRSGPRNTWLTWALTALVLGVGSARAWGALEAPAAAPPPSPTANADGWVVLYEQDLGDLRHLRWRSVREARRGQERGALDGKLTLHFSDQVQQAYPVIEGRVDVQPHRLQLLELTRSQQLGVEWQGHPVQWVPFGWLRDRASPEVLEQQAGPTATRALVRNRSIVPMTVRLRGGWRAQARWVDDASRGESSAARVDVLIAPGGTEAVEVSYSAGPPGATLSPPIVRPIF